MSNPAFYRNPKPGPMRKKSSVDFLKLGFFVVALVVPMLIIAAKQSSLMRLGYEVIDLRDECHELKAEQAKLRAELAGITRPDLVLKEVLAQGLRPPPADAVIHVQLLDPQPEQEPLEQESGDMVAGTFGER